MERSPIYSVAQLNAHIKMLLDGDPRLSGLFVRGELSNYKCYPSGHHYFTLKDREGSVRCVMFKREAVRLRFRPENGMQVVAFGRVTVFPRDGQYQLYCAELSPDGIGDLHVAFEQQKEKLSREGLFDPARKKPLPKFPQTIALITSPAGAAVRDILRILAARYPLAKIILLPVRVQGEEAPPEICAALIEANRRKLADVIILGRGGGSMEDLWAFNDERVARAIYASDIPIISAVGHEPDVTISDYVADVRAATPSNGAELATPDRSELYALLKGQDARLIQAVGRRLAAARATVEKYKTNRALRSPTAHLEEKRLLVDYTQRRLAASAKTLLSAGRERFAAGAAKLDALSPLKVLGRGYCLAQDGAGKLIKSVFDVVCGENIALRVEDGTLGCKVEERMGV